MIAALLLATACVNGPLYQTNGNECTAAQIEQGCWNESDGEHQCSQAIEWGPSVGATYYQLWRCIEGTQTCALVGNTSYWNRWAWNEDHTVWGPTRNILYWYPSWDCAFSTLCDLPHMGTRYTYQVKACNGHGICSLAWSEPVLYVGIQTACYDFDPAKKRTIEVPCYSGDSLSH